MKVGVPHYGLFGVVLRLSEVLEARTQLSDSLRRGSLGGQGGGRGLKDTAHFENLVQHVCLHEVHGEGNAVEEQIRLQAGDVGPIAPADVQDPGVSKGADGLSQGVPRRPEELGEHVFRRDLCARRQFARHDQLFDPLDAVLDARSSHRAPVRDRADGDGLSAARPPSAVFSVTEPLGKHPPSKLVIPIVAGSLTSLPADPSAVSEMGGVRPRNRMFHEGIGKRAPHGCRMAEPRLSPRERSIAADRKGFYASVVRQWVSRAGLGRHLDRLARAQISSRAVHQSPQTWDECRTPVSSGQAAQPSSPNER